MDVLLNPLFILGILCANIAISEYLVRKTFFKKIGTALLVILVTAIIANIGIIPSFDPGSDLYDGIFKYVAPISIFFLLLDVNLKNLKSAGTSMIMVFLIGSVATMAGVIGADRLMNMSEILGADHAPIGGMFTGTYTGGSINFNAVALHYGMNENGPLYATSVAVDNIMTALWMLATLALPKILKTYFPRKINATSANKADSGVTNHEQDEVDILNIGLLLALGIGAFIVSDELATFAMARGVNIPSILILTTISIVLAQFDWISRLRGYRFLGLYGVYLFLAVIGAYCDFGVFGNNSSLAFNLFIYVLIIVGFHGLIIFALGGFLKQDWDIVSIASQANVGGSTSAMAMAKTFGRTDLVLPAILVGTLGNGLGTYLGFLVVGILGP